MNEEVNCDKTGELGGRNQSGSCFQSRSDAYLNERSVIFNEEMVEKLTADADDG